MIIFTIGHSTRTIEEFIALLQAQEIQAVADVRRYPGSRRYPHFNSEALEQAGISYRHFEKLGGRRKPNPNSANTAWRNDAFRGYADYIETPAFHEAITELENAAVSFRTAIMCAEAVWWRCHRSLIADYLKANGIEVIHILGADKAVPHPFTSAARIVDGRLTYSEQ